MLLLTGGRENSGSLFKVISCQTGEPTLHPTAQTVIYRVMPENHEIELKRKSQKSLVMLQQVYNLLLGYVHNYSGAQRLTEQTGQGPALGKRESPC